jgi:hypothetical protein
MRGCRQFIRARREWLASFFGSLCVHQMALVLLLLLAATQPPLSGDMKSRPPLGDTRVSVDFAAALPELGALPAGAMSSLDKFSAPADALIYQPTERAGGSSAATGGDNNMPQLAHSTIHGAGPTAASALSTSLPTLRLPSRPVKNKPTVSGETQPAASAGFVAGGGFEGREPAYRARLVASEGGTRESEQAVVRGLHWLELHQRPDGSWRFNHDNELCKGQCGNPGSFASTTAATGLALLPLLGTGSTHMHGDYRKSVQRGIYYLCDRMLLTPDGGDLQEGSMYSQGLATIALCEAYGMSQDPSLRPFAQSAVDFIIHAQDQRGGGWRYTPGQPGDTTVLGWQLMALKSAQLAGLRVPTHSIFLVEKFLDSVEADSGAMYGYQTPEKTKPTCASIGLLSRMYTGWPRTRPALIRGVGYLEKMGPHATDMYFNYYATQAMHHFGGSPWLRWNQVMREKLVAAQSAQGHEAGSWFFPDEHSKIGGRLYSTCMAIMCLEVYYRYLPIYGEKAVGGF